LEIYGIAIALCPSGEISTEEKTAMQLAKATKVLKRVWKVVVWAELAVVTAMLLYFLQFFSYDVFVSNLYQQASAANPVQPR
jgi:hypothetical protein